MIEREREPCYVACRLWGVNEIDFKKMRAKMVFRVHLIFRPRKEALQFLPEQGRVNSEDDAWKELERLEALPNLGVLNGKPSFTSKLEFFRVSDAKSVYDGTNEVEIWFPSLPSNDREREAAIAVLTYQIEASDVQLNLKFKGFPFDAHELSVKLFLPKKHKDKMYELHCDPNMRVKS